jgi:hypothetical protein
MSAAFLVPPRKGRVSRSLLRDGWDNPANIFNSSHYHPTRQLPLRAS